MNQLLAYIEGLEARINELERRQANMFREGEITEVDFEKGLAVMKAGDIETPASSWLTRAGSVRDWNPVTQGERAIWISPTGDPEKGLILPGGFSQKFAQNHKTGAETRRTIGGYDFTESASGAVWSVGGATMTLSSDGLTIEAGGSTFRLTSGGYNQTGGSKTHEGKNVGASHIHSGVQRGGAQTNPPD